MSSTEVTPTGEVQPTDATDSITFPNDPATVGKLMTTVQFKQFGSNPKDFARNTMSKLIAMSAYEEAIAANPDAHTSDILDNANSRLNDLDERLAGHPPGGDTYDWLTLIGGAFDDVTGKVGLGGGWAKGILDSFAVQQWADGERANYATATRYEIEFSTAANNADLINQAVAEKFVTDPKFTDFYKQFDPDTTIAAHAGDVVTNNPDAFPSSVSNGVQADGTVKVAISDLRSDLDAKLDDVKSQVESGLEDVHTTLGDINQTLGDLSSKDNSILAWIDQQKNQANIQQAQQQAAQAVQLANQQWQTAAAALGAVASVAKLLDPKLGGDIAKYGGAGLQALEAGSALIRSCMVLSTGFSEAAALGCAAATGNFIGAAAQLISLFTNAGGPTPDDMILSRIDDLRQHMAAFQHDVDGRFDRIDSELSTIYTNVLDRLALINVTTGRIAHDVTAVQEELASMAALLSRVEQAMLKYFQAMDREGLLQKIDEALSRKSLGGTMENSEYWDFEAFFHNWARPGGSAWSEIEQPVNDRATDDASLADALKVPIPADYQAGQGSAFDNLSFVVHVLAERGVTLDDGSAIVPSQLPNVQLWSIASQAYAQHVANWPEYAAKADSTTLATRFSEVGQGGPSAAEFLRTLLASQNVFKTLGDGYAARSRQLGQALDAAAPATITRLATSIGRKTATATSAGEPLIDPWDQDLNSPFAFSPTWLSSMLNGGYTAPSNLYEYIPPVFLRADWFTDTAHGAVPNLTAFVGPSWDPDYFAGGTYHLRVTIDVRFGGPGRVVSRTYVVSDMFAGDASMSPPDIFYQLNYEWNTVGTLKQKFEQGAVTIGQFDPVEQTEFDRLNSQTTDDVNQQLSSLRSHIYGDLATATEAGSSACATAGVSVNGARALLETALTLVLEQVRLQDDLVRAILDGRPPHEGGVALPIRDHIVAALQAGSLETALPLPAGTPLESWLTEYAGAPLQYLRDRIAAWQAQKAAGSYDEYYRMAEQPQIQLALANVVIRSFPTGA